MLMTDHDYGADKSSYSQDDFGAFKRYMADDPGYQHAKPSSVSETKKFLLEAALIAGGLVAGFVYRDNIASVVRNSAQTVKEITSGFVQQGETTLLKHACHYNR